MSILRKFGLKPETLELEITESLLMKTPDLMELLLHKLRENGIRIAIDDFGTGYSSLAYLHRFPIDTLKIDQSFVRQLSTASGVSMVKAIIEIARNLRLQVIAEGVESEDEAAVLQSMGCDRAQGYHLSTPLTPSELAMLLFHSGSNATVLV